MKDGIPLPHDGFGSQRERDMAVTKAMKKNTSQHYKAMSKAWLAVQAEQDNIEVLKKCIEENKKLYKDRLIGLITDMKDLIGIIMKHPGVLEPDDLGLIQGIGEKLKTAQEEGENIE